MRRSIVLKLFTLTTLLCLFILAAVYLGQTIFFKQYYANRKVADIQANIQAFKTDLLNSDGNVLALQKLEQDFYRENNTWITTLDSYGNLKNANDFYLEVKTDINKYEPDWSNKIISVPLYHLMNIEEVLNTDQNQLSELLKPGTAVNIFMYATDSALIPYELDVENSKDNWRNEIIAKKLYELALQIKKSEKKEDAQIPEIEFNPIPEMKLNGTITKMLVRKGNESSSFIYTNRMFMEKMKQYQAYLDIDLDSYSQQEITDFARKFTNMNPEIEYNPIPDLMMSGTITKVRLPKGNESSSFMYTNRLFMERMKQFQANLLFDEDLEPYRQQQILDFTQNDVKYKLFIDPIKDHNGQTSYIFSMASLQPVDEAVQMLKDYYVYMIALVLLLIVFVSLYYSRKIARPLLQINETTKRIANLDFSKKIQIKSSDEIGDLSRSINSLSHTLHSYIEQLQQDIEKEKQLESTRKQFISGVSHELKTPLSVMKSCISILKDGVATHKREHYFDAMEKEVDRMDLLIVDMLELAKFESGTYKMLMEPFCIDKSIETICDQLILQIAVKQLHLHTDLISVEVMANQNRIEQVITNFLTNAIRYTPDYEHIYITVREEQELIKVSFENKGTHIPAEQLDKLWDRFYRGDAARHRALGGTGLGLAISKNILELHGVSYGAMNTVDGVLFYFYLKKA
ncbi:HAMP domain-containing sensor histidine kinase [Paenibacillus sp. FSL K6-0276]|uniref:sensor histidine kinase n=1 Tax=Paenibacillus sp. FSL K6-0276 TaxID=2921450 RepID=UPI0030EE5078